MNLILKLIVNSLAVVITAWLLGDAVQLDEFTSAIIVAVVLAVFNVTIKPLMIVLTLPFTIFTFGLFLFVINAVVILITANIVEGFSVANFWWALLFSLV